MQFDSLYFAAAAMPAVLISYLFPGKFRNWFFLVLSLLFVLTFSYSALIVLGALILLTYGFSILLETRKSKAILSAACALIGGLLVFFRFYDSGAGTIFDHALPVSIIVPVGVSFYTLNAISYLADLYTGKLKQRLPFVTIALFLSFFPTVTSGPLLRAGEFAKEAEKEKPLRYETIRDGFVCMLVGYVMKLAVAGRCALLVNHVYGDSSLRGFPVVLAVIAYSLEIYADFAGYSLIAKGLASAIGFVIPDNFQQPYFSASIREFWRRWHMSLSSWLRDYIYIPLGGSHGTRLFKFRNLILTFLVWGLLHALFQIGEDVLSSVTGKKSFDSLTSRVITFALVSIAWVFFTSPGVRDALAILGRCISLENYGSLFTSTIAGWGLDARNWCFLIAGLLVVGVIDFNEYQSHSMLEWFRKKHWWEQLILVWGLLLLILFSLNLSGGEFIYMQF